MKIAMLVHRFPKLSETFILNQITGLLDAGHDVDIHAGRPSGEPVVHADVEDYRLMERTIYASIPLHPAKRIAGAASRISQSGLWRRPGVVARALDPFQYGRHALSLSLLYTSACFASSGPYDVLHAQYGTLGATAVALRRNGVIHGSVVVAFRGSDLTVADRATQYDALFSTADLFLPVCRAFAKRLVSLGAPPERVRVHHSGIDVSRFPFVARTPPPSGEPIRIITVARLEEKKGVSYGIEAIARLASASHGVHYTVVGDGPLKHDLERLVDARGLRGVVELAGRKTQTEVVDLLSRAHLFLAPSVTAESGDMEGIPNVLKEAMATGLPVLSTLHSGIPELVDDGSSGFLVPERDSQAIADRLTFLIERPETWPAMGSTGRSKVEAEFDARKLNRRLEQLYRSSPIQQDSAA